MGEAKPDFVALRRTIDNAGKFLWRVHVQGDEVGEMAEVMQWIQNLASAVEREEKKQPEEKRV
jgi:hypothetical protein